MTVANQSFSDGFVSLISQFHNGTLTSASFAAQLLTLVDSWNGGSVSNAKLSNDISVFVGNQRVWQKELRDWWSGTITGGWDSTGTTPGGGYYPFTNDLGVVSYAPCPALVANPVLGPAGQASNAAATAWTAANTAVVALNNIGNALSVAQAYANASTSNAIIAVGNATSAIAANTSAWTARAGAATAQTNAETANTNAWTAKNASANSATTAAANATIAVGNATIATTKAAEALASATNAASNATIAVGNATSAIAANASAWTARAGAAASEANALTYRNTAQTYATYSTANATIAVGNAVSAAASSNTATTRAIAAETAQLAAETARQQARDYANAAASAAANAAATIGFNINDYQPLSGKGQPNGYASLDVNGKVPVAQLDTAVLGGLNYQGSWNATTNSPTIPTANGANKGQYYKVGTAGTANVGGVTDWQVGDWLISNGQNWDKLDQTEKVQSVAGRTGSITLTKADVGLSSADNTADLAKPISNATAAALALKLDVASKATLTEAIVGADDTKYMTPAKTASAISNAIAGRIQVNSTVIATGSSQTVDLGQDIQPGELLIFVNGVEQDGTDFAKSGTQWTFTRPSGSRIRFMLPGGVRGQSFDPDASGTTAGRSTYDSQPVGFCYLATDTGSFYWRTGNAGVWSNAVTLTGPQGVQGATGNAGVNGANGVNGWSPVLSIVADGSRYVAKVSDWTGGTTGKPTSNVYVTSTGFTSNVALATDIRGPQGAQGNTGPAGANGTSATYSLISPLNLGSANAVGSANVAAREDHVHQFPLARITNTIVTANAALVVTDHGGVVETTANTTLTLPNNLPVGFNCLVRTVTANTQATFAAASGATVRQADSFTKTRKQWSEVSVSVRSNANGAVAEYVLSGDMA